MDMANEEKEVVEFNDEEEDLVEDMLPPEQRDILWALTRPLDEMTLEEQLEAVKRIRELRKVRIAATKKKSDLDYLLAQLTPERASQILKQLEDLEKKQATEKEAAKCNQPT